MLKNARLLMTGLTGQLAGSIAAILAPHNEIYGLARYGKPGSMEAVEALGITPVVCDYTTGDFSGVPDDFDYVFHAAADVFPVDIETGLRQNAEGTGLLLNHLNRAKAWIYVSTSGVYWDQPDPWYALQGDRPMRRQHPDQHPLRLRHQQVRRRGGRPVAVPHPRRAADDRPDELVLRPGELRRRAGQGHHPGGEGEPVPVNPDWEMVGCPIHEDDMAEHLEPFFKGAAVGGTVTNWGGDDAISVEQYVPWVAAQLGTSYSFTDMTDIIAYPRNLDPAKRISLTGPCKVKWQDGFRRDHRGALPRAAGAGSRAAEHRAAGGGVR